MHHPHHEEVVATGILAGEEDGKKQAKEEGKEGPGWQAPSQVGGAPFSSLGFSTALRRRALTARRPAAGAHFAPFLSKTSDKAQPHAPSHAASRSRPRPGTASPAGPIAKPRDRRAPFCQALSIPVTAGCKDRPRPGR